MKSEAKVLIVSVLIAILGLGGLIFYNSATKTNLDKNNSADPAVLLRSDSHQTTSAPLKVNIVEFGDYQCPACGMAHPVIKELLKQYEGKVNFAFRNFPLSQHKNAVPAAKAAEAAAKQGKFWEMHDLLYTTQTQWEAVSDIKPVMVGYAKQLGLNEGQFTQDYDNAELAARIDKDREDGLKLGVNSTPTFFINNLQFNGTLTYKDFQTAIESELKN